MKYLNAHTGIVFLRFPKRCYKLLWSALPFITSVETRGQKIPCFLNCLHVGGKKKNQHTFHNESDIHLNNIKYSLTTNERYFCVVYVFPGTIRTCQKFLIRYNKQQLHRMLPKCKNEGKGFNLTISNIIHTELCHYSQ